MKSRIREVVKVTGANKVAGTVKWIRSWLEQNPDEQLVVITMKEEDARSLAKRIPEAALAETFLPLEERHPAVKSFNRQERRVLVTTFESISKSRPVTVCSFVAFFDLLYNLRELEEVEDYFLPMNGQSYFITRTVKEFREAIDSKERMDLATEMENVMERARD